MDKKEIYMPYLPVDKLDELLDFAETGDFKNSVYKGGTAMYLPFDDNFGVLYSLLFQTNKGDNNFVTTEEFKKTIEEVWQIYTRGGKVAPVLGYAKGPEGEGIRNIGYNGKDDGGNRDVVFVARAPGQTLNDTTYSKRWYRKTRERLQGPDSHYDEVVDTFLQILDSQIRPDITGNNILHHPVAGFNFIDFNKPHDSYYQNDTQLQTHRFLKSFILQKGFPNESLKQEYRKDAAKEQKILVNKLYNSGVIKEEYLEAAISHIPVLGVTKIDELDYV
ncbi:MAG: hypothetical protein FWE45_04010 [Firmicutes bacterium]|nr:hypothetical protein [Bacillota bacterium]